MTTQALDSDRSLVEALCARLADRLTALCDLPVALRPLVVERRGARAVGLDEVHLAFRFEVRGDDGGRREGCALLPYRDAATLAGAHRMLGEEALQALRLLDRPDEAQKDVLRELNRVVAGALDKQLAQATGGRLSARATRPQGVRADVPPAIRLDPDERLLTAFVEARLGDLPAFELLWLLPPPDDVVAEVGRAG